MFSSPAAPLAPMPPDAVLSAFHYLRAVEAGNTEAATGFPRDDPRLPTLLVDVAQRLVVPVTALDGTDPEPSDDSFALEALGRTASLRRPAPANVAVPQTGQVRARTVARSPVSSASPRRTAMPNIRSAALRSWYAWARQPAQRSA